MSYSWPRKSFVEFYSPCDIDTYLSIKMIVKRVICHNVATHSTPVVAPVVETIVPSIILDLYNTSPSFN